MKLKEIDGTVLSARAKEGKHGRYALIRFDDKSDGVIQAICFGEEARLVLRHLSAGTSFKGHLEVEYNEKYGKNDYTLRSIPYELIESWQSKPTGGHGTRSEIPLSQRLMEDYKTEKWLKVPILRKHFNNCALEWVDLFMAKPVKNVRRDGKPFTVFVPIDATLKNGQDYPPFTGEIYPEELRDKFDWKSVSRDPINYDNVVYPSSDGKTQLTNGGLAGGLSALAKLAPENAKPLSKVQARRYHKLCGHYPLDYPYEKPPEYPKCNYKLIPSWSKEQLAKAKAKAHKAMADKEINEEIYDGPF